MFRRVLAPVAVALSGLPAGPVTSVAHATGAVGSFTPDGRRLVVTERATNQIDLYAVGADGLASGPAVFPSPGVTPFGFDFDRRGNVIVSEALGGGADASAVSSLALQWTGGVSVISASVPTTETAACWIATTNGCYAYAGNAGGSISG